MCERFVFHRGISGLLLLATVIAWSAVSTVAIAQTSAQETALQSRHELLKTVALKGPAAAPALREALDDGRPVVRRTAARLLARLGEMNDATLRAMLSSPDVDVRHSAAHALALSGQLGSHVKALATNEAPSIRRLFYLRLLPKHLMADGKPEDVLVDALDEVYREGSKTTRYEIVHVLSGLPLTDASRRLLARAQAVEGAERAELAFERLAKARHARLKQLIEAKHYQQFIDVFEDGRSAEQFEAWPAHWAYDAHYWYSRSLRRIGRPEAAIAALRTAITFRPERRAYADIGQIYHETLNKPDRALEAFQQTIEADLGVRGGVQYHAVLGGAQILRDQGRVNAALRFLGQSHTSIEEMSSYWAPRFLLAHAQTLAAKGDIGGAIKRYRQLLRREDVGQTHRQRARQAIDELHSR